MARSAAQGEKRRQELAGLLSRSDEVSTAAMARRFDVSEMTIRRDLKALEEAGLALRRYGGAAPAQRITVEFAFDGRRRTRLAEKRRIGRKAASRVEPGQTVFLDTGTTTLQVARALVGRGVECTVVTSSLVIASTLWADDCIELVLVGGRVRRGSPDLVGPGTEVMLDKLTADLAFVGSDGIAPRRGSFAADMETAQVAERMAANAQRAVIVADSSKLGHAGAVRYLRAAAMRALITDRAAPPGVVQQLRRQGVEVMLV